MENFLRGRNWIKRPELSREVGTHGFRIALRLWILVSGIKVSSILMNKWLQIQIQLTVSVEQVQPYENNSPADQPTAEQSPLLCFCNYTYSRSVRSTSVDNRQLYVICDHYNNNILSYICLLRLQNLTWGLTTMLHALARVRGCYIFAGGTRDSYIAAPLQITSTLEENSHSDGQITSLL